jgi:23S rRNA (cytosine1962-C5)-methyltransferase
LKSNERATPRVILKRRGVERWTRGHPWIYRSDLDGDPGLAGGEVVQIVDGRGWFLGQAFYSKHSKIALRWLSHDDVPVDAEFFRARLSQADALRRCVWGDSRVYRLVHAEADLLPGLIVDRYGDYLSAQFLVKGTDDRKELLADLLVELFKAKGLMNRSDAGVRALEGLEPVKETMRGEIPPSVEYLEGQVKLRADLQSGQKTGAFLDQRENRLRAGHYAQGEALDCFSYTGAFALHLATRAQKVTAVEISEAAAAQIKAHAALNGRDNIEIVVANAFDYLRAAVDDGRHFDIVVLDPPSFARSKDAIESALRGYKEINLRAMLLLGPGGYLITASCSHHVSEDKFEQMLESAAADARRRFQIVERRGASRDHPVLLGLPETRYLKCFILREIT